MKKYHGTYQNKREPRYTGIPVLPPTSIILEKYSFIKLAESLIFIHIIFSFLSVNAFSQKIGSNSMHVLIFFSKDGRHFNSKIVMFCKSCKKITSYQVFSNIFRTNCSRETTVSAKNKISKKFHMSEFCPKIGQFPSSLCKPIFDWHIQTCSERKVKVSPTEKCLN